MGSSQPSEEVTASADGITVLKRFEEDEFPVPAIAFEFESTRDEPVTVRMRDTVPEGVAVEDLGFHPEYGSEHWTVDDGGISFERELDPGTEYTTVYGIRATGTQDTEQFLMEPTIEAVDPPLADSTEGANAGAPQVDIVPGDQEAVKEAIAGDGTVPGLDDEEEEDAGTEPAEEAEAFDLDDPTAETGKASGADADPETADPDEPAPAEGSGDEPAEANGSETAVAAGEPDLEDDAEAAAAAETRVADTEAEHGDGHEGGAEPAGSEDQDVEPEPAIRETATGEPAGQTDDGSLLAALAGEIRDGEVAEEDVELLREAFGATGAVDGTTEARVRQLQQDVADIRAYTDALEEFLDTNGTARQVLDDTRERIDSFEDQLAEFETTVGRAETDAEEATATARDAEAEVDTLRSDVETVHGRVDDVSEDVGDVEDDVGDVRADVEDLAEGVDDVERDVEDVADRVADVEVDVEGIQEDVEDVEDDVERVDGDVDEIEEDVEDVRGELEQTQTELKGASASIEDLEETAATFEEELEEIREHVHEDDLEGRIDELEVTLEELQEWQTQIKETFGG